MLRLPFRTFIYKDNVNIFISITLLLVLSLTSYCYGEDNNSNLDSSSNQIHENTAIESHPGMSPETEHFPFHFDEEKSELEDSNFSSQLLKMLLLLVFLIGVMYMASWSFKRMLHTRTQQLNVSSFIKVLESRGLSTKSALYLVEVNDKTLLLGETLHSLSLLATFDSMGNIHEH